MLESTLMSTPRASTYLDAIAHLPAGGTLILGDVTWEEYESLVGLMGDHSPVRMSYAELTPVRLLGLHQECFLSCKARRAYSCYNGCDDTC